MVWDEMSIYQTLRKIIELADQISLIIIAQQKRIKGDIFSGKHSTLGPPQFKGPLYCR